MDSRENGGLANLPGGDQKKWTERCRASSKTSTVQWMLTLSAEPRRSRLVSPHCLHLIIFHSQQFRVEQGLLFLRLKYVKTSYHKDLRCMEGTRKSLLNQIMAWVTNGPEKTDGEKYILDLRLTWHRENVVSTFGLCKPP